MIIIVTEKPSVARILAPHARKQWPVDQIVMLSALPFGNCRFRYPRGLAWRDYPYLADFSYDLEPWDRWHPRMVHAQGTLQPCEVDITDELFQGAETIVFACDPDHTGVTAFAVLVERHFGSLDVRSFPSLHLGSLDEASIAKEFANMGEFKSTFQTPLAYGRVKRYFDWNWNTNALAILGATARAVGVPAEAPPLSKYSLQLLYYLEKRGAPRSLGNVIHEMEHWTGTGKYTNETRLGSPASYAKITEDLFNAGLTFKSSVLPRVYSITEQGRKLLAHLHKDCDDPDLPYRLETWGRQGPEAARDGMDRYLRTFFGKQKRFLKSSSTRIPCTPLAQ